MHMICDLDDQRLHSPILILREKLMSMWEKKIFEINQNKTSIFCRPYLIESICTLLKFKKHISIDWNGHCFDQKKKQ